MNQTEFVYKTIGDTKLTLHAFLPGGQENGAPRAAIVFFFGGGWVSGTPRQFFPQCKYLASRGMVAMSCEYRIRPTSGATPFDCVEDGRSAISWVRSHAGELGVDPDRIAAGGGSAGGHVAACTALIHPGPGGNGGSAEDSRPNALVLFNPVVDLFRISGQRHGAAGFTEDQKTALSPSRHVRPGLPPTLIFHGTADTTIPFQTVEQFTRAMTENGNTCSLIPFEGRNHGFFNHGMNDNVPYKETLRGMDEFLSSLGYLG